MHTAPAETTPVVRPMRARWWALLALLAAVVTALVVISWLLPIAHQAAAGTARASAVLDAVRTALAAGGAAGAAVGVMLAFRRQQHQEIATVLADYDATQRRITDMYAQAADQLGSEKAPVRLAGLYALERLAHESPNNRQPIVNVICAYLRMPFPAAPPVAGRPPRLVRSPGRPVRPAAQEPADGIDEWKQEREVRVTAQRILADRLRRSLARPGDHWKDVRLDLTGATLLEFDFSGCTVAQATFANSSFAGSPTVSFQRATFEDTVLFSGATFAGSASFEGVTFAKDAMFRDVMFEGQTSFDGSVFAENVGFAGATFTRRSAFERASFHGASFPGAIFKETASFKDTVFAGKANFSGAAFGERAEFVHASFEDDALFEDATFAGRALFGGTAFKGQVWFSGAAFRSRTSFEGTRLLKPDVHHSLPRGWELAASPDGQATMTRHSKSAPLP